MTKEEQITLDEFFEKLWFGYPSDLCHKKPGVKQKAYIAAKKIKPDQYEYILDNMKALIRYDRQDLKPDRWPHCSTWLNQAYYDRPMDSVEKLIEKKERAKCIKCDQPVLGERYNVCEKHTERKEELLNHMQNLKDLGLHQPGLSLSQLAENCRVWLRTSGAYGKALNKMTSSLKPADNSDLKQ